MTLRAATGLAWVLILSGCADFNAPLNSLPQDARESRLQALENRVADLGRRVDNLNLAAMSQDNSRLAGEMRDLRGEVERLAFLIEKSEGQVKNLYVDLDGRLKTIEMQGRSAKLTLDKGFSSAGAGPAESDGEQTAYLAAFELLKASKFDEAIQGFKALLSQSPKGRYADNAWYWLGECHYVKRDFDGALQAFESLRSNFPDSAKSPDALFKIALVHLQADKRQKGIDTLQQVLREHPNSNAAGLARARLEQLSTAP